MGKFVFGGVLAVCGILAAIAFYLIFQPEIRSLGVIKPYKPTGRSVAVIGDSDSHIYRDQVLGTRRGGKHHEISFQWTEIWARLRGNEVEQGELGVWGTRVKVARVRSYLGLEARYFRKMDFRYNYALSGARCGSIYRTWPYQAPSLLSLMNKKPEWFQSGLVFVRIGINDFGQQSHLLNWAKTGLKGLASDIVNRCLADIRQLVEDVLSLPTNSMVALVDVSRDYNGPYFRAEELTSTEVDNILSVLALFESELREIAANSNRVAYVDDEAPNWGDIFLGTYQQEISLGGSSQVKNGVGDEPFNRTLLDGHAGTISNGLWLQSAIQQINEQLGTGFTTILDAEIADLVDSDAKFGIAPERRRYSNENVRLTGLIDRMEYRKRDLPYELPKLVATSAEGLDVTNSITAYLENTSGTRIWLHGSGRKILLHSNQLDIGNYKLTLNAQDRYGNRNKWYINIAISE